MTIMPMPGGGPQFPSPIKPRRKGLFGSMPSPSDMPMTTADQPIDPKPKFFGEGGVGRGIAGSIGDFLLQYAGMNPIYAPVQQQKQQMAYAEQQRQMQRRDRLEDWQAQEQWKRENPAPVNNDTINDFNWFKGLSPEDRAIFQQMKPEYRLGADGKFYRINVTPPPTITADDWESGAPVNGGPTPSASGGFR